MGSSLSTEVTVPETITSSSISTGKLSALTSTSKSSVFVVAVDDNNNNEEVEVMYQSYNDNDYIRDSVRNHMEEFSKQQALLSDKQEIQKERSKKQREENKNNKQEINYPAMTGRLGG